MVQMIEIGLKKNRKNRVVAYVLKRTSVGKGFEKVMLAGALVL
jgi:hypothetical protein